MFATTLDWGEIRKENLKMSWRKVWPKVMDKNIEFAESDAFDDAL